MSLWLSGSAGSTVEGEKKLFFVYGKRKPTPGAGRNCRGQSKLPTSGKARSLTLPQPHRDPPWPPAPVVPGSAARSPAAPVRCRHVSVPNEHAAVAPGSTRRNLDSPCSTQDFALPAMSRRRFKFQPLGGRGRGGAVQEPSAQHRACAGSRLRGGTRLLVSAPPARAAL